MPRPPQCPSTPRSCPRFDPASMCPRSPRAQRGWYNPAWQTRRFVLDEAGSLHYYNGADGSPPIRSIKAPPALECLRARL